MILMCSQYNRMRGYEEDQGTTGKEVCPYCLDGACGFIRLRTPPVVTLPISRFGTVLRGHRAQGAAAETDLKPKSVNDFTDAVLCPYEKETLLQEGARDFADRIHEMVTINARQRENCGRGVVDHPQHRLSSQNIALNIPRPSSWPAPLAERTGETIAIATSRALEERLRRWVPRLAGAALLEGMAASRRRGVPCPSWMTAPLMRSSAKTRTGCRTNPPRYFRHRRRRAGLC
ncbi:hypothetical protein J2W42_003237 [Rhizobium tibeticum]|nr:hypothetical protein [Rhizobium tibeticum]